MVHQLLELGHVQPAIAIRVKLAEEGGEDLGVGLEEGEGAPRRPTGLGLERDATNTLINVVKGGAADVQGYFRVGDTIASVDGIPLRGRLLQEVMDPNKSSYSFDVWRLTKPEPPAPVKKTGEVRRALSFDRKRR